MRSRLMLVAAALVAAAASLGATVTPATAASLTDPARDALRTDVDYTRVLREHLARPDIRRVAFALTADALSLRLRVAALSAVTGAVSPFDELTVLVDTGGGSTWNRAITYVWGSDIYVVDQKGTDHAATCGIDTFDLRSGSPARLDLRIPQRCLGRASSARVSVSLVKDRRIDVAPNYALYEADPVYSARVRVR